MNQESNSQMALALEPLLEERCDNRANAVWPRPSVQPRLWTADSGSGEQGSEHEGLNSRGGDAMRRKISPSWVRVGLDGGVGPFGIAVSSRCASTFIRTRVL